MSLGKAKNEPKLLSDGIQRDDKGRRIYCVASGCPMKASVFMEGANELCSWHAKAPFVQWPQVTQELKACMDSGKEPKRPEIRSAPWVIEARAKFKAMHK